MTKLEHTANEILEKHWPHADMNTPHRGKIICALVEALEHTLQIKYSSACTVCWTYSWGPVKNPIPKVNCRKVGEKWEVCQLCLVESKYANLQQAEDIRREANDN